MDAMARVAALEQLVLKQAELISQMAGAIKSTAETMKIQGDAFAASLRATNDRISILEVTRS